MRCVEHRRRYLTADQSAWGSAHRGASTRTMSIHRSGHLVRFCRNYLAFGSRCLSIARWDRGLDLPSTRSQSLPQIVRGCGQGSEQLECVEADTRYFPSVDGTNVMAAEVQFEVVALLSLRPKHSFVIDRRFPSASIPNDFADRRPLIHRIGRDNKRPPRHRSKPSWRYCHKRLAQSASVRHSQKFIRV